VSTLSEIQRVVPADIVRGISHLAPLPATAQRLLALLRGEDEALTRIARLVESDQALVASLLRRANSARYAATPAHTVLEAVMRVGTVSLLDIVVQEHMRDLLVAAPTYGLDEHDLWIHGAAAQLAARAIRAERPKIAPVAETAALLHDIGKLIISRYLKVDARELTTYAREHEVTCTEAERRLLGFDHTIIGAAVAEHWHFPDDVAFAIRHHHDSDAGAESPVLDTVVLANIVAKMVGAGLGAEGLNFSVNPSVHKRLGVTFELVARLCLTTQDALRELPTEPPSGPASGPAKGRR
jgi:putative nucleotidyltransferase with HDIG domain